jgi:hybrid cluster-associated redox disulfide protein
MTTALPLPTSTVTELLELGPAIPRVLLGLGTACVGCSLMKFCTVEDVARVYGFDVDNLLRRLQGAGAAPWGTQKEVL